MTAKLKFSSASDALHVFGP